MLAVCSGLSLECVLIVNTVTTVACITVPFKVAFLVLLSLFLTAFISYCFNLICYLSSFVSPITGFAIGAMVSEGLQLAQYIEMRSQTAVPCINANEVVRTFLHIVFIFTQLYFVFMHSEVGRTMTCRLFNNNNNNNNNITGVGSCMLQPSAG